MIRQANEREAVMTEAEDMSLPAAAPASPSKVKKQDRSTMILLLIASFVAVGGIGFALGHVTASGTTAAVNPVGGRGGFGGRGLPSLAPGQTFDMNQFGGGFGGRGLVGGAGTVAGTIQSVDGSRITVQLANGTTETIVLSGTTTYHGETSASSTDVKIGSSVLVRIDTAALASQAPNPDASGGLGGRTLTAKDVIITQP
jgi:hypothetical protein